MMLWAKPEIVHSKDAPQHQIDAKMKEFRNSTQFLDLPDSWVHILSIIKTLALDYGFVASEEGGLPCDGGGRAIPLYTYPIIEYLKQLDFRNKSVFEYGSGQSSAFWAKRAQSVVSVENNQEWYEKLSLSLAENQEIIYREESRPYIDAVLEYEQKFDVIIVDGGENRYACAINAIRKLNHGGMVILDNSDWHFNTARILRESDLIQVDMSGFKPADHYTSTTSLFLHRAFNFQPVADRQPGCPIGGKEIHSDWDKPAE